MTKIRKRIVSAATNGKKGSGSMFRRSGLLIKYRKLLVRGLSIEGRKRLNLHKPNLKGMAEMKQFGIDLELDDSVAQGHYSNLAIISHSTSEFIIDFATVLPGVAKARVRVALSSRRSMPSGCFARCRTTSSVTRATWARLRFRPRRRFRIRVPKWARPDAKERNLAGFRSFLSVCGGGILRVCWILRVQLRERVQRVNCGGRMLRVGCRAGFSLEICDGRTCSADFFARRLLRPSVSSARRPFRSPLRPPAGFSVCRPFRSPLRPPAGFSVCRPFRSPLRPPGSEHLGHDVGASADEDHVFGRSLFASPLQGLAHLPEGFTL